MTNMSSPTALQNMVLNVNDQQESMQRAPHVPSKGFSSKVGTATEILHKGNATYFNKSKLKKS